jgi:hypothetical protein
MEGTVRQGVLLDEAMEVLFQRARDLRRSTGTGVVHEAWRTLMAKAMDPLAQRGIGTGQRDRDGVEALAFDDVTHRLGAAQDPSLLRLFHEDIEGGQSVIGKAQFESPHGRDRADKVRQKYVYMSHTTVCLPAC